MRRCAVHAEKSDLTETGSQKSEFKAGRQAACTGQGKVQEEVVLRSSHGNVHSFLLKFLEEYQAAHRDLTEKPGVYLRPRSAVEVRLSTPDL